MARRPGGRTLAALGLAAVTLAAGLAVRLAPAAAAGPRPLFQLPFACDDVWRLSTYNGHDDYDIDMFATSGTTAGRPILASYGGTVDFAGWNDGAGWYVKLNHGGGWQTLYLHMRARPVVTTGLSVARGRVLGYVGSTGSSSAPHLHFEQVRDGAKTESWFNGAPSGIRDDATSPSVRRRSFNCAATVSVYGALADGRLTYTAISADTGRRTHGAVVSTATLGFTPKAMATLDFNTILVTSTEDELYRVDVSTNNASLVFYPPVRLADGWSHDLLAYDGNGHLFGITGGTLHRYTVRATKPEVADISTALRIDSGFTLKTLTANGPDRITGTTADGRLLSYQIRGADDWTGAVLKASTWGGLTHLLSPGAGIYYGHTANTALNRYLDSDPYDGSGADLHGLGVVDAGGWSQILLSAQPFA
jgi:hypothetical protein